MADAQTPVLTDEQIVLLARRVGGLFDDLAIGFQTDDILNFGRSVLAAQAPAQPAKPAAWAATSDAGEVEALGMNQSRRFDTPLYFTAPSQPDRAVMQQALDALRLLDEAFCANDYGTREGRDKGRKALIATRAAIAALSATMEKK